MKNALGEDEFETDIKISKETKMMMQQCVTDFVIFVTSEGKTLNQLLLDAIMKKERPSTGKTSYRPYIPWGSRNTIKR